MCHVYLKYVVVNSVECLREIDKYTNYVIYMMKITSHIIRKFNWSQSSRMRFAKAIPTFE